MTLLQDIDARHNEIAFRYGKATKPKRSFSFAALRITELRRLLQHRYGHTLPNDAAGRDAALVMAHHKARLGNNPRRGIHHFFELSCPWMTKADMSTMANAVMRKSLKWSADKLAARLQITETERRSLRLCTVGSMGTTKAERQAARKERNRVQQAARRKAKGAKLRADYEAAALTRLKPWVALDISRRTWYRRRQPVAQGSGTGPWTL